MRQRLLSGLPVVTLLAVLVLCASFCLTELAEVDFHWHLLAGRTILSEGSVPRTDDFTYTSRGTAWIDLQWMFETLVALVERHAGWLGLDWLKIVCITGGFAFALLAGRRRASPAILAAAALPAILASQERFTLRPEVMSFLLLGLFLWIYARGRSRSFLWLAALPPLLALWANLHALFAVGLGLLALAVVGEWIDATWRRPAARWEPAPRPGALALAAFLALAGTLLTPYGLRGWTLPRRLFLERMAADNLYTRSIAEFQFPFSGLGPATPVVAFTILALAVGAGFAFDRRRTRSADVLMTGACLLLALMARRNLPLFAIVALSLGAPGLESIAARLRLGGRPVWNPELAAGRMAQTAATLTALACALFLMVEVWSNDFFARDGTQRYFGRGEAPGVFPEAAAAFLTSHPVQGEILNDMTIGGFLASRWYPERRVFIDGRLEVHDATLFATYLRLQIDPQFFEETARRFGIDAVLWGHRQAPRAMPLLRHLSDGHGWRPVFADLTASIFVREPVGDLPAEGAGTPPAINLTDPSLSQAILAQAAGARLRSEQLDPAPAWLRRMLPRRPVPVAEVSAALFFAAAGVPAAAESLFREAVSLAPRDPVLRYDLGLALRAGGQAPEARLEFERSLDLDDTYAPAHNALALLLAGDGRVDEALRHWARAERGGALDGASLEVRGALLSRLGRLDEAIEDYRRMVRINPGRGGPRSDLALLYLRRGLTAQAAVEIERAVADDPNHPRPRLARAVLMAAEGRSEAAIEALREAIDRGLDPAQLQDEPAFRILVGRPEYRELLGGPRKAPAESPR